jgi:hypothetical protein
VNAEALACTFMRIDHRTSRLKDEPEGMNRIIGRSFLAQGSRTRILAPVLALIVSATCGGTGDPTTAALVFVVEDLAPKAPSELTPYLAPEWQGLHTQSLEPIPSDLLDSLRRVTGLPVAPHGFTSTRDSTMAVLYLFEPWVIRPDSVLVLGGWMGLVGGDGGGAWGIEFPYHLDCRRGCRLLNTPLGSHWN